MMTPSDKLERYAELLRGSPHNLLSSRALDELETRHFQESRAFAVGLPVGPRLLDIGSGGGLPGVIIALERPDLEVHLMEATGKKAAFLEEVAADLRLPVVVHHGRAELLQQSPLRASFDIVTARAVAPLDRLTGWAAPYLRQGGTLHAIKGDRWLEELEEARIRLPGRGLRIVSTPDESGSGVASDVPRVVVLGRGRSERLVELPKSER